MGLTAMFKKHLVTGVRLSPEGRQAEFLSSNGPIDRTTIF
jgi:hypothetical protein